MNPLDEAIAHLVLVLVSIAVILAGGLWMLNRMMDDDEPEPTGQGNTPKPPPEPEH